MQIIFRQFTNGACELSATAHRRIRQLTTLGFAMFFAKGMLWIAAAIWFAI